MLNRLGWREFKTKEARIIKEKRDGSSGCTGRNVQRLVRKCCESMFKLAGCRVASLCSTAIQHPVRSNLPRSVYTGRLGLGRTGRLIGRIHLWPLL